MSQHAQSANGVVAVVIPCYNASAYVGQAIASVLAQTYQRFEIVVVDDGSTDDSYEAISHYKDSIKILRQHNQGVANARNAAIRSLSSEYIAYLDADDRWLPHKLQVQVDYLEQHPNVAAVHSGVVYIDADGSRLAENKVQWFPPEQMTFANLLRHNTITLSSVLQRRSSLDDELFAQRAAPCEDWDLWLRLVADGHRVGYIADSLAEYRVHSANSSAHEVRMNYATIAVMDRWVETRPVGDVSRFAMKRRATAFRELGREAYRRGDMDVARRLLFSAWRSLEIRDIVKLVLAASTSRMSR